MENTMKNNDIDFSFADKALGEIAVTLPGSTAVFRRHGLDFCCGGKISLKQATEKKGLDLSLIESDLAALAPGGSLSSEETPQVIAHIVTRYHDTHRRELPELEQLARRIEERHGQNPACPKGITALIQHISAEMLEHMEKEETVLFPMMLRGGSPMIRHPIDVMRQEHESHGANLRQLAEMTQDFTPPAEACNTWKALYAGLGKLAADLTEHISLENNLLFPRFEK